MSYLCNMTQPNFTRLFSDINAVKSGLTKEGVRLTNDQVFTLLLIKELMTATGKITVTKREVYEDIAKKCLGFSRSTLHRVFNALVKNRFLLPVGVRDNSGWLGVGEEYRLTVRCKRVDILLGLPSAA